MRSSHLPWLIVLASHSASALPYFGPISTGNCSETLATYNGYWNEWTQNPNLQSISNAIYDHQEFILGNATENIKATMSSATILLGLTPVLLQSVGPTVNELGLMSMQRPGLATLLALGAAAVSPSRMFGYHEDWKLDEFLEVGSLLPQTLIDLLRENRSMQGLMCAIQYIVAAGSVANTFYTSYQLGVASVNNFDCTDSLMPLFWTLVPVVIHAFIALSFWRVMLPLKRRKEGERTLSSILKSSVTISIAQDAPPVRDLEADSFSSLIYWVISVIGWVHNVFGILVFSSLLFVEIADAVTILLRYFASTIFCQAVIRFEISSMRARYDAEPQHKESQSRSSSQEASKA